MSTMHIPPVKLMLLNKRFAGTLCKVDRIATHMYVNNDTI